MEQIRYLIDILLFELPQYRKQAARCSQDEDAQRRLLRGLMNLRPPLPLRSDFLAVQDQLLIAERQARGVVEAGALPACARGPRMSLWQGDITRLGAGAIINAANSALLGCFFPCHGCIEMCIRDRELPARRGGYRPLDG